MRTQEFLNQPDFWPCLPLPPSLALGFTLPLTLTLGFILGFTHGFVLTLACGFVLALSSAQSNHSPNQIMINLLTDNTVPPIRRMRTHKLAGPARRRPELAAGPLPDQIEVGSEGAARLDVDIDAVEVRFDEGDEAGEAAAAAGAAIDNLVNAHLRILVFDRAKRTRWPADGRRGPGDGGAAIDRVRASNARGQSLAAEPKLGIRHGIAGVRRVHVLGDAGNGNVEVEIKRENGTGDEHDKDAKGGVFKIRQLNLHRAELDAPANVGAGGRRLEAHVLPVGRLEILKMVRRAQVEALEIFIVNDNRVADEQVGKVRRQQGVHTAALELRLDIGIVDELGIVILGTQTRILGNVGRIGRVAGFGDTPSIMQQGHFAKLFVGAVVDRAANLIPADIGLGEEALVDGGAGRQGQHDGTEGAQLVVQLASLVDILGLKGDLQAAAAHAKGHGVHVDVIDPDGAVALGVVIGPVVEVVVDGRIVPGPGRLDIAKDGHVDLDLATATSADARGQGGEALVRIGNLVGDKLGAKGLAGRRIDGRGEDAGAETGKGGHGDGMLLLVHVGAGQASPPLHVGLDVEQVGEADAPGPSGRRLEHVAAKLGVEDGQRSGIGVIVVLVDVLQGGHAAALLLEGFIAGEGVENLGLSQGQGDIGVVVGVVDDEILDLVAPEEGVSLLAFGAVPVGEQLLGGQSDYLIVEGIFLPRLPRRGPGQL